MFITTNIHRVDWHLIHQREMVISLSMVTLDDLSFVLIS